MNARLNLKSEIYFPVYVRKYANEILKHFLLACRLDCDGWPARSKLACRMKKSLWVYDEGELVDDAALTYNVVEWNSSICCNFNLLRWAEAKTNPRFFYFLLFFMPSCPSWSGMSKKSDEHTRQRTKDDREFLTGKHLHFLYLESVDRVELAFQFSEKKSQNSNSDNFLVVVKLWFLSLESSAWNFNSQKSHKNCFSLEFCWRLATEFINSRKLFEHFQIIRSIISCLNDNEDWEIEVDLMNFYGARDWMRRRYVITKIFANGRIQEYSWDAQLAYIKSKTCIARRQTSLATRQGPADERQWNWSIF